MVLNFYTYRKWTQAENWLSMWQSKLSIVSPLTLGKDGLATVWHLFLLFITLVPWEFKFSILWFTKLVKSGVALLTWVIFAAVWAYGIMLSKAM